MATEPFTTERLTLTVPEAARLLGISRGLCYEIARQGGIPTLRLGRRLLVPRAAFEKILAGAGDGQDTTKL